MGRIALGTGVAAVVYALLRPFVADLLSPVLDSLFSMGVTTGMAAVLLALIVGLIAAYTVFSKDQRPPAWFGAGLIAVASVYLLLAIAAAVNVNFGKAWKAVDEVSHWSLAATAILMVRFLPPRIALFLGVGALALQFEIGGVLGLAAIALPSWIGPVLTVGGAALIAFLLASSDTSAATRVRDPAFLWAFGAAGLLTLMYAANFHLVPRLLGGGFFPHSSVWSLLAWFAFLGIFVALAGRIEPLDAEVPSSSPRASGGTLLVVFLGLSLMIGLTFSLSEQLSAVLEQVNSVPTIACALLAGGVMFWMRLPARIPADAPGRGLVIAGLVAFAIAVLGGWRIAANVTDSDSAGPFLGLIYLALLVAPLVTIGGTLVGLGMLQVMFNLEPVTSVGRVAARSRA